MFRKLLERFLNWIGLLKPDAYYVFEVANYALILCKNDIPLFVSPESSWEGVKNSCEEIMESLHSSVKDWESREYAIIFTTAVPESFRIWKQSYPPTLVFITRNTGEFVMIKENELVGLESVASERYGVSLEESPQEFLAQVWSYKIVSLLAFIEEQNK